MTDEQRKRFDQLLGLDFGFGIPDLARFRGNAFFQRGSVAGVFRVIPERIKGLETLGLPTVVKRLARKRRGLVVVTGPTGSGKSTTLASMIDKINRESKGHIITVEDPIEYLHKHQSCIVNQREVHSDVDSFASALRTILREDPDVVLIGEMRDLETVRAALRIAETGHLTLATLHTNSAYTTINRIVDLFSPHHQDQVRTQLSLVLEGIVCQNLLPRADGMGRLLAAEILIPTAGIRNLIRENKVHQIYSMMQSGQGKWGSQTMNQSLARLLGQGKITLEVCFSESSKVDELEEIVASMGVTRNEKQEPKVGLRDAAI
jgi:twitching motility protein PilT